MIENEKKRSIILIEDIYAQQVLDEARNSISGDLENTSNNEAVNPKCSILNDKLSRCKRRN